MDGKDPYYFLDEYEQWAEEMEKAAHDPLLDCFEDGLSRQLGRLEQSIEREPLPAEKPEEPTDALPYESSPDVWDSSRVGKDYDDEVFEGNQSEIEPEFMQRMSQQPRFPDPTIGRNLGIRQSEGDSSDIIWCEKEGGWVDAEKCKSCEYSEQDEDGEEICTYEGGPEEETEKEEAE